MYCSDKSATVSTHNMNLPEQRTPSQPERERSSLDVAEINEPLNPVPVQNLTLVLCQPMELARLYLSNLDPLDSFGAVSLQTACLTGGMVELFDMVAALERRLKRVELMR